MMHASDNPHNRPRHSRRGAVLIVALLVMIVLASVTLVWARQVRVQVQAAANRLDAAQAMAIALGAAEAAMVMQQQVYVDGAAVGDGLFWILRPDDDDQQWSYGLVDEAGKININTATAEMLERLPRSSNEIAEAIIAWRGGEGDHSSYYLSLDDPYAEKGAAFETVEELLLVRGITPIELYGEDANRNGVLDPNEDDGDVTLPPDNADGVLDRGMFDFVTVYSRQPARRGSGDDGPVNVNSAGQTELRNMLRDVIDDEARRNSVAQAIRTTRPHRNIIDLYYNSTLDMQQMSEVEPLVIVGSARAATGLININTAPREVLLCLPSLDESDVDAIIAQREGGAVRTDDAEQRSDMSSSVLWITEAIDREKAIAIGDLITGSGHQFSADIVALGPAARAFQRIRIVFDTSGGQTQLLAMHRLSHLGWPLDPELRHATLDDSFFMQEWAY